MAKPSRRVFIPKQDGRLRPLGIAVLEDKIVQAAVVEILNAIYESDFLGFSYGFRSGRGAHQALDALVVSLAPATKPQAALELGAHGTTWRSTALTSTHLPSLALGSF